MADLRSHPRMEADYEVFVKSSAGTLAASCRDISPGGIGIFCERDLAAGEPIALSVVLSDRSLSLSVNGTIKHCSENRETDKSPLPYLVGVEFDRETAESYRFLQQNGDITTGEVAHTVTIDAPADKCYQLIADFPRYPEWVKMFETHAVKEKHPDGRPRLVEWTVNVYLRKVKFLLDYDYDDDIMSMSWTAKAGDLIDNTGRWTFRPRGDDRCFATFELKVAFDFPAPARLVNYFSNILMRKSMTDFGKFVAKNQ